MNIFFDTSSLFKLYHFENETDDILSLFNKYRIEKIFLA